MQIDIHNISQSMTFKRKYMSDTKFSLSDLIGRYYLRNVRSSHAFQKVEAKEKKNVNSSDKRRYALTCRKTVKYVDRTVFLTLYKNIYIIYKVAGTLNRLKSKHLQIRNETKLNYQFDFGLPKQNKIQKILILFQQN
jgi:hypothetical protein